MARLLCPVRSMATRSGTFARIRLRAAVRRQSWRKRVGTPAAWQAVRHAVRQRRIVIPSRWNTVYSSSTSVHCHVEKTNKLLNNNNLLLTSMVYTGSGCLAESLIIPYIMHG